MNLNLIVLAAGMGSRYGGLKQLDPMGPSGETVLDYSVYDAIKAGFKRVIFVIRKDFEEAFIDAVGQKFEEHIEVAYAYQNLASLPDGFSIPDGRKKPWGTAHAVIAAREYTTGPFAVINADDFYGTEAYIQIADFFQKNTPSSNLVACMVAYPLRNTLSENGTVNRGICRTEEHLLISVEEHLEIHEEADTSITGINLAQDRVPLEPDSPVSMNFWGFSEQMFSHLETHFIEFLKERGQELKSECYLPSVVDTLVREQKVNCSVITTRGQWFGVTYPSDKPQVKEAIAKLVEKGDYPSPLHFAEA